MTNERVLSFDTNENAEGPIGVRVLVVDCNSACLAIVEKMLHICGYKVTTAKRATDALQILREKRHELDLILTEIHLPDKDKYELLETIGEISCLPVVILSAENKESAMLGCLFKGAVFYLVKPIHMSDVKNLWQFSRSKNRKQNVASGFQGPSPAPEIAYEASSEYQSGLENCEQISQSKGKRKALEEMDKDEEDSISSTLQKKQKLIWTNELHERFLQAVRVLGIDSAHPKKILNHMNVPGLKKENVSSHLQKYRLSLKRGQDAPQIQKSMLRDDHLSPWNLERGISAEFLRQQILMTRNQSSYVIPNQQVFDSMSISASFPIHAQLPSVQSNQINYSQPAAADEVKISRNNNVEEVQIRNENVKEEFWKQRTICINTTSFIDDDFGMDILGQQPQQDEYILPPLSPLLQYHENGIFGGETSEIDDLSEIATFCSEMFLGL